MQERNLFLSPNKMTCLEHYGASMVTAIISLQTLEAFHLNAFKLGLLNESMEECSKTICWELRRTIKLYETQLENVLEHVDLTSEELIKRCGELLEENNGKKNA